MNTADNENLMKLSDRLRNLSAIMAGGGGTKRIDRPAWLHILALADQVEALEAAVAAIRQESGGGL